MGVSIAFFMTFKPFIRIAILYFFPKLRLMRFSVDEDLENYFKALDFQKKNWWIKEEENCRKTMNFRTLDDETYRKLVLTDEAESTITGVHCYDILANPKYVEEFQYVPADVP